MCVGTTTLPIAYLALITAISVLDMSLDVSVIMSKSAVSKCVKSKMEIILVSQFTWI